MTSQSFNVLQDISRYYEILKSALEYSIMLQMTSKHFNLIHWLQAIPSCSFYSKPLHDILTYSKTFWSTLRYFNILCDNSKCFGIFRGIGGYLKALLDTPMHFKIFQGTLIYSNFVLDSIECLYIGIGSLSFLWKLMIKEHIKDFSRQEIYYGNKKANVSATNGGSLQCQLISWT